MLIKRLATLLIGLCFTLSITGCHHLGAYEQPIEQGHVLNAKSVHQLKYNMSKTQVQQLLGKPILNDPFDHNRWTYVYTSEENGELVEQHHLILRFKNNQLQHIQSDLIKKHQSRKYPILPKPKP